MKKTAIIIIGLIIHFSTFSQSNIHLIKYQNDLSLSNKTGIPLDSTSLYFPINEFKQRHEWFIFRDPWTKDVTKKEITKSERQIFETELSKFKIKDSISYSSPNTYMNEWFSFDLFKLSEPILSNFYLDKETYRFTLISSIYPTFTIRIEINNKTAKIYTKELERLIESGLINKSDTIYPDNNIPLSTNTEREISLIEIERIRKLLDSTNFYCHNSYLGIGGIDGSEWIFECHTPEGYYFSQRYGPDITEPVHILGEYFISLSDLKNKK